MPTRWHELLFPNLAGSGNDAWSKVEPRMVVGSPSGEITLVLFNLFLSFVLVLANAHDPWFWLAA